MTSCNDDDLLTAEQVADWLGVPERTIRYWREQGTGPPYVRLGRWVRYRRGAVRAWLREQEQASRPPRHASDP